MKFLKNLAAFVVALAVTSVAMAQFNTDQGTSDSDTKVSIKQMAPRAAELTFTGVKVVYLNKDPKIEGIKSQVDASKKGRVWVVDIKAAPEVAGADVVFTGVGSAWGVGAGNRVDADKVKYTKLAEEFTLPITIAGNSGCAGFTYLVMRDGIVVDMKHLWVSHPGNASYLFKNGGTGMTDMVTLLCTDKEGNIAAGTPEQAKAWAPVYTAITTAKIAKK